MNSKFLVNICLFLSVLFSACGENEEKKAPIPPNILKKETMISILVDMHILEAASSFRLLADSSRFVSPVPYQNEILKKYGTNKKNFMESLKYFADNYEEFEAIYDEVIDELSRRQAAVEK